MAPLFPRKQLTTALFMIALACTLVNLTSCMSKTPLVPLAEVDPTIGQEPKYFGSDNFMGRPIRGYNVAAVWLSHEAAAALTAAQKMATEEGYSIFVYDGYRPQRAVDHFVEWGADLADSLNKATFYPDVPKEELFDRGYISAKSGHSRGSTADLTITKDGIPLEMGTPFDFFDELSHTENPAITGQPMTNRMILKSIMERAGFTNYENEWWHYTLKNEPYPDTYFDLPIE